eukprot:gene1215-1378_t
MGISVLAHRKILLKAIEDLRKNKRVTRDLVSDSSLSDVGSSSTIQRSSSNSDVRIVSKSQEMPSGLSSSSVRIASTQQPQPPNRVLSASSESQAVPARDSTVLQQKHWSTLKPLSSNKVSNDDVPVNAADDAVLDEAAEREAFQRAVMEWRRGASTTDAGSSSLSVSRRDSSDTQTYSLLSLPLSHAEEAEEGGAHRRDPEGGGSASSKAMSSRDHSLWKNPFLDGAGTEGAGVGEGDALLDLLADDTDVKGGGGLTEGAGSTRRGASRGASRGGGKGGGSLLGDPDTYLDEAKEHEAFVKAVEAWRSGSADPEKQSRAKALKLAAQMDAQHATRASRLHREQEEAE